MSDRYSIRQDLREALKMAEGLANYVQGDQLYGNIGGLFGTTSMPALTIGALLMRIRRLYVLRDVLSDSQKAEWDQVKTLHDSVQQEWRVHYENKMIKEAKSRLGTMRQFFMECVEDPRLCAGVYKPEASRRTIVQEILIMMEEMAVVSAEVDERVAFTDGKLRSVVRKSAFMWSDILEPAYPEAEFWWLYHTPPST